MSDQPQQPGDAAPSASGEDVPSTGTSTPADSSSSTPPTRTGEPFAGVGEGGADEGRAREGGSGEGRAGEGGAGEGRAREGGGGEGRAGGGGAGEGRAGDDRTAEQTTTAEPDAADAHGQRSADRDEAQAPLFAADEGERLRGEWESVQAAFVDDPRAAVQRANALVSEVVQNLTASFTGAQSHLEQQWSQGEDVSTEDLRQALHRYRSFFERLLRL